MSDVGVSAMNAAVPPHHDGIFGLSGEARGQDLPRFEKNASRVEERKTNLSHTE